jgi:hypothetical protein
MERPAGVTVLAVLLMLFAAFAAFAGLALLLLGLGGGAALQMRGANTGMSTMMAGMGALGGVFLLALAAAYVVLGVGLLKLLNWARVVTLVLIGLGLLFAAIGLLTAVIHFRVALLLWQLCVVAIDAWIIWYLLRPDVKQAFGQ